MDKKNHLTLLRKDTLFSKGISYTSEEIKDILGSGTYGQVIVLSKQRGILCVRFQSEINPNWCSHQELWIHEGKRRVPDAKAWVISHSQVPVFCHGGKPEANFWQHLGLATATISFSGSDAKHYTGVDKVALVVKMHFNDVPTPKKQIMSQRRSA